MFFAMEVSLVSKSREEGHGRDNGLVTGLITIKTGMRAFFLGSLNCHTLCDLEVYYIHSVVFEHFLLFFGCPRDRPISYSEFSSLTERISRPC